MIAILYIGEKIMASVFLFALFTSISVVFFYKSLYDSIHCIEHTLRSWLICALCISCSITFGIKVYTVNRSRMLHLDDRQFQEKLISSYKEKYPLDEEIIDYSKFIEETTSEK